MGLEISVGALLLASWFAMALTGALLLQTYIYFRYKPKDDRPAFGILVWFVLLSLRYSCKLTSSWRRCYYGEPILFFSQNHSRLIHAVSCLDITHVMLTMNALYTYLVIDFGNEAELGRLKP